MCPPSDKHDATSTLKTLVGLLSLSTVGLLAATIALAVQNGGPPPEGPPASTATQLYYLNSKRTSALLSDPDDNTCAGKMIALENKLCADLEVAPQAGANVTRGYVGNLDMGDVVPNTQQYWQSAMCPVNVHWHLGTEHYSAGEYDENGSGPNGNRPRPEWAAPAYVPPPPDLEQLGDRDRRDLQDVAGIRGGFRCGHYDATDPRFTTEYNWQHCIGMQVGETYEVHWPHSAAGACGTVDQYQTPFYDGVFCNLDMAALVTLTQQQIASAVGVHGQVFTIINDESFFYPDMIRGMVKDASAGMGTDVHVYTGSTTGTSRDNEVCSTYAPITWQVDRKCHLISASSFDKLCFDMKMQRDDMMMDLHAHGSRELVHDDWAADNQWYPDDRRGRNLRN